MKEIKILIGLPGAGKSTYANKIRDEKTEIISSDEVRFENFGQRFSEEIKNKVYDLMKKKTVEFLKNDFYEKAIIDSTYLNEKEIREDFIKNLGDEKEIKIKIEFLNLRTELAEAIKRDSKRLGHLRIGEEIINKLNEKLVYVDECEIEKLKEKTKNIEIYKRN